MTAYNNGRIQGAAREEVLQQTARLWVKLVPHGRGMTIAEFVKFVRRLRGRNKDARQAEDLIDETEAEAGVPFAAVIGPIMGGRTRTCGGCLLYKKPSHAWCSRGR